MSLTFLMTGVINISLTLLTHKKSMFVVTSHSTLQSDCYVGTGTVRTFNLPGCIQGEYSVHSDFLCYAVPYSLLKDLMFAYAQALSVVNTVLPQCMLCINQLKRASCWFYSVQPLQGIVMEYSHVQK
jgi:hypothetical protein